MEFSGGEVQGKGSSNENCQGGGSDGFGERKKWEGNPTGSPAGTAMLHEQTRVYGDAIVKKKRETREG